MGIYGLTGGIGVGKTTVANLFKEFGIPVVLADSVGREVVEKGSQGLSEIVDAFGDSILDCNGDLNRKALASTVFTDPANRRQLEGIIHPLVLERSRLLFNRLIQSGNPIVIYESALLFETNRHHEMEGVILINSTEKNRISRVQARDGSAEDEVKQRIQAQMDEIEKLKLADYLIENNTDLTSLKAKVESLITLLLERETATS